MMSVCNHIKGQFATLFREHPSCHWAARICVRSMTLVERLLCQLFHFTLCQPPWSSWEGMLYHNYSAFVFLCLRSDKSLSVVLWFDSSESLSKLHAEEHICPTPPDHLGLYRICASEPWLHSPNESAWHMGPVVGNIIGYRWGTPPYHRVDKQTLPSINFTFPRTSYVGGNKPWRKEKKCCQYDVPQAPWVMVTDRVLGKFFLIAWCKT